MCTLHCNRPNLHHITDPDSGSVRVKRYRTQADAAKHFDLGVRGVERWVREGFIAGYRDSETGAILVDLDEIESAFRKGIMRDPRKRYGSKARIVPLPIATDAGAGK